MRLIAHEKIEVLSSSELSEQAKYKLQLEISGPYSKQKRRQSMQSLKARANFPGFRKGTIPPFIMKDVNGFILRDCVDDLVESAIRELDLSRIDENDTDLEMDVDEMMKRFIVGEDFVFSCELSLQKALDLDSGKELEPVVTLVDDDNELSSTADETTS